MKKKSFLSGFNAKMALTIVALSGALLTGCYKDEGLDVTTPGGSVTIPTATYTLTGTVINADGELVTDATVTVTPTTTPVAEVQNGASFTAAVAPGSVKITVTPKADAGYKGKVEKTVNIIKVPAGQAAVYTETIVLTKDAPIVPEEVEAVYDLSVVAYGSDAMAEALPNEAYTATVSKGGTPVTALTSLAAGVYNVVITPKDAAKYESYVTTLSLPSVKVAKDAKALSAQVIGLLTAKSDPKEYAFYSASVNIQNPEAQIISLEIKKNGAVVSTSGVNSIYYVTEKVATDKIQLVINYSINGTPVEPIVRTFSDSEKAFVVVLKGVELPAKPGDYPLGDGDELDIDEETGFELDGKTYEGSLDLTRLYDEDSDILTTYEGTPDGLQFINKPLHISFNDKFAGELGQLNLQYRDAAGKWGEDQGSIAGNKGAVVYDNAKKKYVMNIWHFSAFRARLPIADSFVAKDYDGEVVPMEGEYNNNEETSKDVIIKDVKYLTGVKFDTTVKEAVEKEFKNANAAALITARITKILLDSANLVYSPDFTHEIGVVRVTLPEFSCISDLSSVQSFKETVYTFVVAGKTITITVTAAVKNTVKWTLLSYGHGHGHDHGHGHGSGNAGGGIVEAE